PAEGADRPARRAVAPGRRGVRTSVAAAGAHPEAGARRCRPGPVDRCPPDRRALGGCPPRRGPAALAAPAGHRPRQGLDGGGLDRPLRASTLLALGDPVFTAGPPPDPPAYGVMVKAVLPAGHAARAGLQAGDVLLTVAGRRLESADNLEGGQVRTPAALTYW